MKVTEHSYSTISISGQPEVDRYAVSNHNVGHIALLVTLLSNALTQALLEKFENS